jgi:signal transduction histidine kinase
MNPTPPSRDPAAHSSDWVNITLSIAIAPQADQLMVEITDSGIGIPPDMQTRIFEPFFTTKSRGGSSVKRGTLIKGEARSQKLTPP